MGEAFQHLLIASNLRRPLRALEPSSFATLRLERTSHNIIKLNSKAKSDVVQIVDPTESAQGLASLLGSSARVTRCVRGHSHYAALDRTTYESVIHLTTIPSFQYRVSAASKSSTLLFMAQVLGAVASCGVPERTSIVGSLTIVSASWVTPGLA